MPPITSIHRAGAPVGQAKALVIMFHGLGANGPDLLGLAEYFGQGRDDIAFIAPDAPQACDMAPVGFQWFSLQDRDPDVVLKQIEETAPDLAMFIHTMAKEYDVPESSVMVMGFSQGAMLSLYMATRFKPTLAGVMAYSGALAAQPGPIKLPVLLVHGMADEVVPFNAHPISLEALKAADFDVDAHAIDGLGHGIDEKGLSLGHAFVNKLLP